MEPSAGGKERQTSHFLPSFPRFEVDDEDDEDDGALNRKPKRSPPLLLRNDGEREEGSKSSRQQERDSQTLEFSMDYFACLQVL